MASKTVTMTNPTGLPPRAGHVFVSQQPDYNRPGDVNVEKTKEYEREDTVEQEGKTDKGKSLLKLLSIGIKNGSEVTVHAEGPDADKAVEVLGELLAPIRAS